MSAGYFASRLGLIAASTVTLAYKEGLAYKEMAMKCWEKLGFEMQDDENSISNSPPFKKRAFTIGTG